MSKSCPKHLAEVKRALAKKYANLAVLAGSEPKRKQFQTRATMHERQAVQFERTAAAAAAAKK
jgi:hypothetical protein